MTESKAGTKGGTGTNGWATDQQYERTRIRILSMVAKGLLTGVIGGMAAFTYTESDLMASPINPKYVFVLLVLAGAFAHLLTEDLRESVRTCLLGFFIGGGTMIIAWIAPLWLLPFSGTARDLLLHELLKNAVGSAIIIYMSGFLGSYFLALMVDAYVSS